MLRRRANRAELSALEQQLGHQFADPLLLSQALMHPSFGCLNNQRLAWLGDGVLKMILSDELYHRIPEPASTGTLHKTREKLEQERSCAALARKLGLDQLLVVSGGYEGSQPTERMLAGELSLASVTGPLPAARCPLPLPLPLPLRWGSCCLPVSASAFRAPSAGCTGVNSS